MRPHDIYLRALNREKEFSRKIIDDWAEQAREVAELKSKITRMNERLQEEEQRRRIVESENRNLLNQLYKYRRREANKIESPATMRGRVFVQ